jgi:tetratricopeptide (TPR) repeat protein
LNPSFAPAYDRLAAFLGMRHRNLDEARLMGLKAISLDPANVDYRINVANVLLVMGQGENAVRVLENAAKVAKTPQEGQAVDNLLMNAREYAAALEQNAEQNRRKSEEGGAALSSGVTAPAGIPHLAHQKEFVASGPHHFLVGVLKAVHCDTPMLDLTVSSGAKTLALHADNYYKIEFTTLNFTPKGDLEPCNDLENRPAKVEYVESADKSDAPHLIAVELHK